MSSFTIQLHHLHFYATHGVFEEEEATGNAFEVNVELKVKAPKEKITALQETVNYAEVYRIIKEIFAVRKQLLETLAMEIAEALKEQFPAIKKISIQIIKLHPPIEAFSGSVSVTYDKRYKD